MKKLLTIALLSTTLFSAPAFADHYEFDKAHTHVNFYINHLGFSDMFGQITEYSGGWQFDESKPEQSSVDVTLNPASIHTASDILDSELRGEKFFETGKFPEMHFKSTSIKITGKDTGDVTGDLTMHGITKPVTLHVHFNKAGYHPMTNLYMAGFNAEATLKRSDFGINYAIPMVSDDVRIEISTEGVNQDRKKQEAVKH